MKTMQTILFQDCKENTEQVFMRLLSLASMTFQQT